MTGDSLHNSTVTLIYLKLLSMEQTYQSVACQLKIGCATNVGVDFYDLKLLQNAPTRRPIRKFFSRCETTEPTFHDGN